MAVILLVYSSNLYATAVRFDFYGNGWVNTLGTDAPGSAFTSFTGFVSIDDSQLNTAVLGQDFLDWSLSVNLLSNDARLGGVGGATYFESFNPENATIVTVGTNRGGAILDLTGATPELQMIAVDTINTTFTAAEVNNWRFAYPYMTLSFKNTFYSPPLGSSQQFEGLFFISQVGVVPVPASVWLFGSGLIGLIGVARRKQ